MSAGYRRFDADDAPEFDDLFDTFVSTAFRLETLQHYESEYESALMAQLRSGKHVAQDADETYREWRKIVRSASSVGKSIQRVHVVAEPLSDYMRFEVEWSYSGNVDAGEDIRIIPVSGQIGWPKGLPGVGHDYWLFDDSELAFLHYDLAGRFYALDIVEDTATIAQAVEWRQVALRCSISLEEFMARAGNSHA